jgi:hypothetical protein
MMIKCPACGASASLDALIDDDPAAQALLLALKITPVGRSLVKYLGLFRPAKRQLSWSKVASLLGELQPLIEAQRIERNGIAYDAPNVLWEVAIDKVLQMRDLGKLQTPLKTHGYLFDVMVTESSRVGNALLPTLMSGAGVGRVGIAHPTTKPLSATAQALADLQAMKGGHHVAG